MNHRMRHHTNTFFVAIALMALSPASSHGQTATTELGLEVFVEVCLKTAPSFKAVPTAAAKFGIKQSNDLFGRKMGFGMDETLIVQYIEGNECVVNVPPLPFANAENRFIDAVTTETGLKRPQRIPFVVGVETTQYILEWEATSAHSLTMRKRNN